MLRQLCIGALLLCLSSLAGTAWCADAADITLETYWYASPSIRGLEQARQRVDGALVVPGRLSGIGVVNAGHMVIDGVLAPGRSPGCIDFGGNVTFSASASFQVDIGGLTPCTEYDQITVANQLTLNGPTLELILYGGFVPDYGDRFNILDWGSLSGTFGSIDTAAASLPSPLVWDASDLYSTGEIMVGVQHIADGDLAPWNNPDTSINAADLMIAFQLLLGKRTPDALQYAHGDMDNDGDIDMTDLLLIQKLVLP